MAIENGNVTVFGKETDFDGILEFTDNLIITGKFKGEIKATGALEVEKTADCDVSKISAQSIVVYGRLKGDLEGVERVELCNGSSVKGNIKTSRIRIADNVEFDGEISMLEDFPEEDLFAVASKEFKDSLILKISEAR